MEHAGYIHRSPLLPPRCYHEPRRQAVTLNVAVVMYVVDCLRSNLATVANY